MKQDKQPNAVARLPKYSHDLSYSRSWTSSTGHIIPVVSDFLNAGETINCSIDLKTRMQPILRPAMLDIHQKIKYFFVPMDMLYSLFGAIRYQVNDFFSSALVKTNLNRPDGFPLVNFYNAFTYSPFYSLGTGGTLNYSLCYSGATLFRSMSPSDWPKFSMFDQFHQGAHRLFDALGYDPNVVFGGSQSTPTGSYSQSYCYAPNVFPYKLLAYQAIYFNYFRDEDYEEQYNSIYNVDALYNQGTLQVVDALDYCNLRYVNRFKDFFTNLHPGAVISETSMLNYNSSANDFLSRSNDWLADDGASVVGYLSDSKNEFNVDSSLSSSQGKTVGYVPFSNSALGLHEQQINASQLRLLFAVDKLLTVTGRARKRVDDQVLAHFGFKVPLDIKHNIQYLGEQDGSFGVGDVVSTAETSGAVLGELAGKAFGRVSGNGVKKFTAPCDGVFMGVYYSMPKVRYMTGYDRQNAVASRTDLFIPEFDHLGMQPLFYYQIDGYLSNTNGSKIYGWQWRYEQWKRKFDTVSAAFRTEFLQTPMPQNYLSAWSPVMRPDKYSQIYKAEYQSLKVTPHDLDNIMVQAFNSTASVFGDETSRRPYVFYETDPFIHDMFVSYKKLSTMSTFSVPNLDNNV